VQVVTVTLNPCVDKSCAVERVVPDRKLSAHAIHHDPGGGGINAARVIARLGGDVRALWTCGGATGDHLAQLLDAEGVAHQPIRIRNNVRENLIVADESSDEQYRFGMPGPELDAGERQGWRTHLRELSPRPEYLIVSGSLPPGVSVDDFAELLTAIPDSVRVVVDSKRGALARAIASGVYLVKPNLAELAELVEHSIDGDEDIVAAARELIAGSGTEVVLVSLGRGGALLVTDERVRRYSAPTVPIRSKVGAGDSLVGGLVAALARGEALEDAVTCGVAAGAAAVMTPGTQLCRREDVERLLARVTRAQPSMPEQP
jgi:6-phosphofructokinase 2